MGQINEKKSNYQYFLTILCLALTYKLWIKLLPYSVSFDCLGSGEANITTYISKRNNDEFKHLRDAYIEINLDKDSIATFEIEKSYFQPRRIRFGFSVKNTNQELTIKNITLQESFVIKDLENMTSNLADLSVKNNSLVIKPKSENFTLTYTKPINKFMRINFDIKIFLIIAILSYMFSYKLTSYLADFKVVENHSRLDIIFLTLCVIIMFIPMSKISKEKISPQENRMLTTHQPLVNEDGTINYNFGNNYNNWISDRFFLRETLIKAYTQYKCIANNYYEDAKATLNKKNNWEFNKEQFDPKKLNEKELKAVEDSLNGFNDFCKKQNIKLYILIVPSKYSIYWKNAYPYGKSEPENVFAQNIEHMAASTGINITYPLNEFKQASADDYVFFKTDHHWTDYGAFTGYKAFMNAVKKDYPKTNIVTLKDYKKSQNKKVRSDWSRDFHTGSTSGMLNLPPFLANKILDTNYAYYDNLNENSLEKNIIERSKLSQKDFHYQNTTPLKVLLTGTSMNENLLQFLPYSFRDLKYIRLNQVLDMKDEDGFKILKNYGQEITQYKPDIIVFCITPDNFRNLVDLTKGAQ